MVNRIKSIFIFIITILLATGVYIWFYPMNKGKIIITTGHDQYSIIAGNENTPCDLDPCKIVLKSDIYNITIQKNGYLPKAIKAQIQRGKTSEISVKLKKNPTLNPVSEAPKEKELKKLPEKLKNMSIATATWNLNEEKLIFLDNNDNKLKIWKEGGDLKTITTLKNIGDGLNLYLAPSGNDILGNIGDEIYFININKASRNKQILKFIPKNITWSPDSEYLLVNNADNKLYKIDFLEKSVKPMETTLDLNNAAWTDGSNMIYFDHNKEERQTTISHFDVLSDKKTEILTKYDFLAEKIVADDNNIVYIYNSVSESWNQLDF